MTDNPVLQTVELGLHWPTIDPFLFCAHHLDIYPPGDDRLGPTASLEGRELGMDFTLRDGWRMYHGSVVPGFPQHPHRGFETVTYVRSGFVDHSDSLGATARFGQGDVQWLTAGSGIVHCEMFPLLDRSAPNPTELFQIWVNLPATNKMVDPHFTMFWNEQIPKIRHVSENGAAGTITVIAGQFPGSSPEAQPLAPPPDSWASTPESDLAIWHLSLEPGAALELPRAAHADTIRVLYLFDGQDLQIGSQTIAGSTGAVVRCEGPVTIGSHGGADCLVLQARPIGEPVAQQGPFVMNTRAELMQAFEDYRRTGFGGWPWSADDPVHAADSGRFAKHPDGRMESAAD
jgi:redox-sensitive bicupin YhaK (pirin superfamily)